MIAGMRKLSPFFAKTLLVTLFVAVTGLSMSGVSFAQDGADAPAPAVGTAPAAPSSEKAAEGQPQQPGMGSMLMPIALTFIVFYFLLIRPQQRKQKAHEKQLDELKPGEEVLTNGGIYGKIHRIQDKEIVLEIANNVRVRMLKSSIAGRTHNPAPAK